MDSFKYWLAGCLALLISFTAFAQLPDAVDTSVVVEEQIPDENYEEEYVEAETDTNLYIRAINISRDSLARWKSEKGFAYLKNLDSLLRDEQRKRNELEEKENAKSNAYRRRSSPGVDSFLSSTVLQVFLWILAGAFVLFILYRLFLNKGIFIRDKSATAIREEEEKVTEETVSDYGPLIAKAVTAGDYRTAVRYQFLQTLQLLFDRGYLQHMAEKTNYQYTSELRADKQKEFASLVLNYEYSWYGHASLNKEQYEALEQKFKTFNSKT